MAQLVEQRIRNAWVAGSSPAIGSLIIIVVLRKNCGISTSVVHGLPKPGRRVRFPYSAHNFEEQFSLLFILISNHSQHVFDNQVKDGSFYKDFSGGYHIAGQLNT